MGVENTEKERQLWGGGVHLEGLVLCGGVWIRRHRPCGHTPTGQMLALSLPILFLPHRNVSSFLRHTALLHVSVSSPVSFLTPRIPFPATKIHRRGPLFWEACHPWAGPASCFSSHTMHQGAIVSCLKEPSLPAVISGAFKSTDFRAGDWGMAGGPTHLKGEVRAWLMLIYWHWRPAE